MKASSERSIIFWGKLLSNPGVVKTALAMITLFSAELLAS